MEREALSELCDKLCDLLGLDYEDDGIMFEPKTAKTEARVSIRADLVERLLTEGQAW